MSEDRFREVSETTYILYLKYLALDATSNNILGLQPIPGDPKDNGVSAMLDDRTVCFVIQHGRHAIVFLDLQGMVANQELRVALNSFYLTFRRIEVLEY